MMGGSSYDVYVVPPWTIEEGVPNISAYDIGLKT